MFQRNNTTLKVNVLFISDNLKPLGFKTTLKDFILLISSGFNNRDHVAIDAPLLITPFSVLLVEL